MRGGDLLHHMKPQNVRSLLVLRRALQCRQNGRRIACAIVRDGQAEAISGNIRLHLDLYGCAAIIKAHGGEIDAESRPGEGTTIRFWLETEKIELEDAEDEQ